jgi:benzylsuccinate CoA-transferase BbsF subunit
MLIDQSQAESAAYFLGPAFLDYFANGRVQTRQGNRDPQMVPHGIFPCCGEDEWVAIAVSNEDEWRRFCHALGREEWLRDERFATLRARKQNEDELEKLISEWTKERTSRDAMECLHSAGVPAGIVATNADLFNDPQLKHRQHFGKLEHPVVGSYSYERHSFKLSKVPYRVQRPAPFLGEHNALVLKEFLGYTDDEIADFLVEGVITTEADFPGVETIG